MAVTSGTSAVLGQGCATELEKALVGLPAVETPAEERPASRGGRPCRLEIRAHLLRVERKRQERRRRVRNRRLGGSGAAEAESHSQAA
jgi:hypothetical protein